jgi:hypothetical protein
MKTIGFAVAVLVSSAAIYAQAAITGKWQGESPNGSKVVFDVKATDAALTGTLTVDGQRLPLADGKVSKNRFTFSVHLPPNDSVQAFTGELAQDELKLWMDQRGQANAAVLKRMKD